MHRAEADNPGKLLVAACRWTVLLEFEAPTVSTSRLLYAAQVHSARVQELWLVQAQSMVVAVGPGSLWLVCFSCLWGLESSFSGTSLSRADCVFVEGPVRGTLQEWHPGGLVDGVSPP